MTTSKKLYGLSPHAVTSSIVAGPVQCKGNQVEKANLNNSGSESTQ